MNTNLVFGLTRLVIEPVATVCDSHSIHSTTDELLKRVDYLHDQNQGCELDRFLIELKLSNLIFSSLSLGGQKCYSKSTS